MSRLFTHLLFVVLPASLLAASRPAAAQLDTTHVPTRPAAQLDELQPFFGTYVYTDNYYGGMGPWRGTLTVRSAIKGWYVEWTINTRFGPIDRQLTMLTTWDEALGRYRIWRFETLPQDRPGAVEAEGRLEGGVFIMEWKESRGPNGERGTFRNRISMMGPDSIVIISEVQPEHGPTFKLGDWKGVRISR